MGIVDVFNSTESQAVLLEHKEVWAEIALLKSIIKLKHNFNWKVIYVTVGTPSWNVKNNFKGDDIHIIDLFSNYDEKSFSQLFDTLKDLFEDISPNIIVVLDSLNDIIFSCDLSITCQLINNLRRCFSIKREKQLIMLVSLLNVSLFDNQTIAAIETYHSCVIHINPKSSSSNQLNCTTVSKSSGGKIMKYNEIVQIDQAFKLFIIPSQDKIKPNLPEGSSFISDLTFKLSLKDSEIKQKEKVALPYMNRSDSQSKSGDIFYEPDSGDDWDDEDPDDDLDL